MAHSGLRLGVILCVAATLWGQSAHRVSPDPAQSSKPPEPKDKRIFWIIPNYRTYPTLKDYKPLTRREKFTIARQDALDPGTFLLAAAFAGKDQYFHGNPSFGLGAEGYAHRFVTSYADWVIGDYLTESIYPSLLHQDPRYFRRGEGSAWARLGWAVGQIFWTRTDSGRHMFNFSEIGGNATAVAISNAYYPDGRTAQDAIGRMGIQIGLDMTSNILKEFWPDLHRLLQGKKNGGTQP